MNPVLTLPVLIPLLLLVFAVGIYASWRSSHHAKSGLRKLLLGLRVLALLALCVFLLNPGDWIDLNEKRARVYPVLIDDSASMLAKDGDTSRLDAAKQVSVKIQQLAEKHGVEAKLFAFSDDAKPVKSLDALKAAGSSTALYHAGANVFSQLQATGVSPESLIVLSDGRQTVRDKDATLVLQSRAHNAPIFSVNIGSNVARKDLVLSSARNTITAFPGQNLQVTGVIEMSNLPNQSVTMRLLDSDGKELAKQQLEVADKKVFHTFSVKAPADSTKYLLEVNQVDGEQTTENNKALVNIRVLKTKTRVFIAEGAPYWDSKFLAQLLRQQGHMNVHSVHRLSDERWFRIDSGESAPHASSEDVFPDTPEELARYDLIIFGKNAEHFLTDSRIELLKAYVRDQGGAVLFARGKPYSGRLPALESLEPVNWATGNTSAFTILPSEDGQSAGLFGQALPAPDSPVWKSLPDLKDAHQVESVKPFTRVLAEGEITGRDAKFPLLLVRRYGQGVSGLVNADGLWKWDFYPEARELGNMYQEFWTQLIQWMVAYSEFLPGYDYAIHASNQSVELEEPIVFSLAYRGAKKEPKPKVQVLGQDGTKVELVPAISKSVAGKPSWKCSFVPSKAGSYTVTLISDDKSPSPSLNIVVNAPPSEDDNLNPDPALLQSLSEKTGGKLLTSEELLEQLEKQFQEVDQASVKADTVWQSSWMQWFIPLIVLAILAAEWWIRRRSGLI